MAINWNYDGKLNTVKTPTNSGSGAGYLGKQLGLGALGLFEGLFDFVGGGVAELTGNKELAQSIIENDLTGTLTKAATEKYNPSKGMQVAGDVVNTLGQVVGQTGLAVATGGVGSIVAAGASGAGRGVTQAYQETGELGGKEWGYGLLSGTLEGGLEALSPVAGKAAARLTGRVTTKATKGLIKTAGNGIVKTMFKEGMGEFMEEAISEIANPYLQKITYNHEAETSLTAPSQRFEGQSRIADVLYAGMLGFIGGATVSGVSSSVNSTRNLKLGTKVINNGNAEKLLATANALQSYGDTLDLTTKTKNKAIDTLNKNQQELYKTLNSSVAKYESAKTKDGTLAKIKLGEISGAVSNLVAQQNVQESIEYIEKTADDKVAYLNSEKSTYKKANGTPWTAEDIKNDTDGITTLLAVSDVAMQMTMGDEYYDTLSAERLLNSRAYEVLAWKEQATPEQVQAFKDKFGVDITTATVEQIKTAILNGATAQTQAQETPVKAEAKPKGKTASKQKKAPLNTPQSSEGANTEAKTEVKAETAKITEDTTAKEETEVKSEENKTAEKATESTKETPVKEVERTEAEKEVAATKEEKIKAIARKEIKTPSSNEKEPYYKLTKGQIQKINTTKTKFKSYSLADSETIINNVLSNYLSFGDKYGEISGKTKKQVIDMLWKGLNVVEPGYRTKVGLDIADYIIHNSVLENIWGNDNIQLAVDTIAILKPYLHSIDLSGIKGEIKHKYDTDKSPYILWGKLRGTKGVAPDVLVQELEENGLRIESEVSADIFFQIDELYRNAVKTLKNKSRNLLSEGLSESELKALRQEIAREILKGYNYTGAKDEKIRNIERKVKLSLSSSTDSKASKNTTATATVSMAQAERIAKEYFPAFQHLGVEKKGNILNTIISGRQQGVEEKTLRGAIEIIARSKNLSIEFQGEESFNVVNKETGEVNFANGFHRTSGGTNFAVVNATLKTEAIRETLIHEVWHNAKGHGLFKAVNEKLYSLYESESPEQAKARVEQYRSFFNGMTEAEIKEELAADYFGKKLGSEKAFSDAFIVENQGFFKKCRTFLTNLASKITNKDSVTYKQTKELETLFKGIIEKGNSLINDKYGLGNGYDGYSMSNNARSAYESGEKPLSKWLLSDFKEEVKNALDLDVDIKTVKGGYKKYLKRSSWHHTSKLYNKTDFYSIDINAAEDAIKNGDIILYTQEELNAIAAERTARNNAYIEKMKSYEEKEKQQHETMKQELLTCEAIEGISRKKNKTVTFIITDKQPLLQRRSLDIIPLVRELGLYEGYIPTFRIIQNEIDNSGNAKYSLSTDSNGNPLTEAQAEFFKDSKVRDEQGRLLEVYHGTNAEFTVFKESFARGGDFGVGYYFTDIESYAKKSAANREIIRDVEAYFGGKGRDRVMSAYLDIKKPAIWQNYLDYKKYTDLAKEEGLNIYDYLRKNYDGIIVKKPFYDNEPDSGSKFYVVFNSSQIKLTTNLNPTANEDIRYSLKELSDTEIKHIKENNTVPDGWYVHGRAGLQNLDTGFVIQLTKNLEVAEAYSKHSNARGSVWLLKPNEKTRILDMHKASSFSKIREELISSYYNDSDNFPELMMNGIKGRLADAINILSPYEYYDISEVDDNINQYLSEDEINNIVLDKIDEYVEWFDPSDIVIEAEAYDDADMAQWLEDNLRIDFVILSDDSGAVALNYEKADYAKLPNDIKFSLSTDGEKIANRLNDGLTDESGIIFTIAKDIKPEVASLIAEEYSKDDGISKAEKASMLADRIIALGDYFREETLVKKSALGKDFKARNKQRIASTILSTLATREKAEIQTAPKVKGLGSELRSALATDKDLRKRVVSDTITSVKIAFTDSYAGAERAIIRGGENSETAQAITQNVRTAQAKAMAKLGNAQYNTATTITKDNIDEAYMGKGLNAIFKPIKAHGTQYKQDFYTYLAENLNIDRMKQGKEVTGNLIEDSKAIIAKLDRLHPEFKAKAEEVWAYCKNGLEMDLAAKIISQERYDELSAMYPHYVPSYRDMDDATAKLGISAMAIGSKIAKINSLSSKTATGSTKPILDFETSITLQTIARENQLASNLLANAIYDTLGDKTSNDDILSVEEVENTEDQDEAEQNYAKIMPKDDTIFFYRNGKLMQMKVTKYVFAGFNTLHANDQKIMDNAVMKIAEKGNQAFKELVTSANPFFIVRNFSRDLQEAMFYTKYGTAKFMKNYATAFNEVKNNGKLWKLYQAMGGFNSSVFDFKNSEIKDISLRGFEKADEASKIKMIKQVIVTCENANLLIEQLPRFAEFCASMNAGNTAQQALLDSADITCNFGRSGNIGKVLNRTFFPFLNPAIQGCSKFVRTIHGARSMKAVSELAIKATILGLLPQFLSALMYKDDDDYEKLTDFVKENYWLIKVGDKFFKLPKGRVNSFITSVYLRSENISKGESASENIKGIADSFIGNLTPVENFTRGIYSPVEDIKNNTTWYGGIIEGYGMENLEPKYRYDESTSSVAIAIGNALNKSPKKIHYLLDSYSGVLGDIFLPMTTQKAETSLIASNFTIDPVTQNSLSSEFKAIIEETTYQKTNAERVGDTESAISAKLQLRYLNKVKASANAIFEDINVIQASDLSNAEKKLQTSVLRGSINQVYTTALTDIEAVQNAILATSYMEDETLRYTEVTRLVYGSERALREYNTTVYNKAKALNSVKIDWDAYYMTYFNVRTMTSDLDEEGNAISGSKKAKVQAFIETLDISSNQKVLLMLSFGYSMQNTDKLLSYLNAQGLTEDELTAIKEVCGIEDGNEIAV